MNVFSPAKPADRHRSGSLVSNAACAVSVQLIERLEARQLLSATVPGFLAPTTISTGATPTAVVTDDFNQDGNEDIAVAQSNNTVAVLLGNGDGTFSASAQFATGANPTSIATGDFNNDGADDIVTADAGSGDVSILLQNTDSNGNALGTFAGPQDIHIEDPGGGPMSVAVEDFNNDGNLDIAVGGQNGLYVLLGNGDGTFAAPQLVAKGDFSGGVVADSFTNSGNIDLAALNPSTNSVAVFPGNGDGTFAAPASYTVATGATSIASGDLNNDGAEDIAVTIPSQNEVEVFFQNTTTVTVPDPTPLPIVNPGGPMIPLAAGSPVNLTTTTVGSGSGSSGGTDSYTYQEGDGTFAAPVDIPLDQSPSSLTLANVTGSYNTDIVTANTANDSVTVIPGNGDGTFGTPVDVPVGTSPVGVAVDDFNNDGGSDLVSGGSGGASIVLQQSSDVAVSLAASSSNATFGSNLTYTATITNNGPGVATDISFDDYLPGNFSLVSATSSQGTVDTTSYAGDVNASIGDLASGASATVSVVVNATQYGPASNSVYVSSDSVDSNYDNDSATLSTPVAGATGAELALTSNSNHGFFPLDPPIGIDPILSPIAAATSSVKAVSATAVSTGKSSALPIFWGGGGFATVGQNFTYTFTINNYGPDAATGVNFTDALPANATFVSATSSQGTTDSSTAGTLNASIGDLAPGASATVSITVTPTAAGDLSSAASVTTTASDPYLADNSDTFNTYVYSDKSPFPIFYTPTNGAGGGGATTTLKTTKPIATGVPTLSVTSVKNTASGKKSFVFTVSRSGNLTAPSTVSYTTLSGSAKAGVNFKPVSGELTFAAGAATQTVSVPIMGLKKPSSSQSFVLSLSHPSNARLKQSRATGTILATVKPAKGKGFNPFAKGVGINFEPAGGPSVPGYLADTGQIFGARSNGLTYGWSTDNVANAVLRHAAKDQRLNTFNVLGQGGASNWQISLPNGRYSIKLSAGDPTNTTNSYAVDANGSEILTGTASAKHPFVNGSATVKITNGVLTLTAGSNVAADDLDYLKIKFIGA